MRELITLALVAAAVLGVATAELANTAEESQRIDYFFDLYRSGEDAEPVQLTRRDAEFEDCDSCTDSCVQRCAGSSSCQSDCRSDCSRVCDRYEDRRCDYSDCNSGCLSTCGRTSSCRSSCSSRCQDRCRVERPCERPACVSGCSSRCKSDRVCESDCSSQCSRCPEKLDKEERVIYASNGTSSQHSESKSVNVTSEVVVTSHLNNTIYIPITITNTNYNNVSHYNPQHANVSTSGNLNSSSCCMMIPPKQCSYNATAQVSCESSPQKVCNESCKGAVVVYHPKPVYIQVPVHVPHYVNRVVEKPVYRYIDRPVVKQEYVRVPYLVQRPYPVKVPYPVPYQVSKPYPVKVPVPVPYPVPQRIPHPVPQPYPVPIPQPAQRGCREVLYNNVHIPSCQNFAEASVYRNTDLQFLIDDYRHNDQYQDCSSCLYCQNRFSLKTCMNSNLCSSSCREYLRPFASRFSAQNFKCSLDYNNKIFCV